MAVSRRLSRTRHSPGSTKITALRLQSLYSQFQFRSERPLVAAIVELTIVHVDLALDQSVSKVPHARQKHHDASFVSPDVRRLFGHFCHPDRIVFVIEIIERSGIRVQLIAQHDDQMSTARF